MYLVEEYFLQVEKHFEYGDYSDGKKVLEDILEMEPGYGRAHNHLGWLYYTKFDDFKRAGYHFRLGIKFAPEYPATYLNYSYLLNYTNKHDKLKQLVEQALKIEGVNKCTLYSELGKSFEKNGLYEEAKESYKDALKFSMTKEEMDYLKQNMERIKTKKGMFNKNRKFLLF